MNDPTNLVPDVGGREATVLVLRGMLYQSAIRRRELQIAMVANGHSEDDPAPVAPGMSQTKPDGTVNSYRVLLNEIAAQECRLAEAYPAEMEMIRASVEKETK